MPFRTLQDRRGRQPPRAERGLAVAREARGERTVGEDLALRVAHAQGGVTLGEGGAGDPDGRGGTGGSGWGRSLGILLGRDSGNGRPSLDGGVQRRLRRAPPRHHKIRQQEYK